MKKYFVLIACLALTFTALSQKKNQDGWTQMFNGKDLTGWDIKIEGYPLNNNFANTFRVENGLLKVSYDGYGGMLNNRYGHIFYKKKYAAYLVVVEYRFYGQQPKDGPQWAYLNNGIMLHCQSPQSMWLKQDYPISIECQLLGSDSIATRTNANVCTPGTNVVMDGKLRTDHCIGSDSKPSPGYEWAHVEALVLGDSVIKHIVGTDTVLVYEKPSIGGGNVNNYDPAIKKDGQLLKDGYIALQSESMPTEFRKVEIFDLGPYLHDPVKLAAMIKKLQHRNDKR
ncbi:DUF1080 domain-containing protein [Hanamia caeni]|uniref:DUF1080 domain-containing protein n=1 Tax=Hanamia caeni TaxID=2294116 RepID=A0A3M9N723_9BACT|nr:DUF1080 domain-containing protein [Hanamia caeni]RNI32818.1 DUF1080 domain-containing protein [Hanamia caeni]